jgi:hypothetical protein
MGIKQIEQFSDIILHFLRFLAESSGVAKLELFQPFPHCKWGFSSVPTPPDSGKTPQLKASKLAQNCGNFFFPSNAFMASARSFNTLYGIAKALISKLTRKAVC